MGQSSKVVIYNTEPKIFFMTIYHRPLPTNVWWENMVLDGGDLVSNVNPYIVKMLNDGIHVSLPTEVKQDEILEPVACKAQFQVVQPTYVLSYFTDNVAISASESLGDHEVTSYDDLSVTVKWDSGYEVPVVRGMPYVTVFYTNLTPVLKFGHAVLSVTGCTKLIYSYFILPTVGSGTRFEVELNNNQKWIVYSSESISLTKSGDYVISSSKFTGYLRVAGVWIGKEGDISILDQYSTKVYETLVCEYCYQS